MRVFLAVSCGERFALALTTALDTWRYLAPAPFPVRWTRAETWHLTLQFLGEWPENRLFELKSALDDAPLPREFTLESGQLGGFPALVDPRVLFLHMVDDGPLAHLASGVREIVNRIWPEGPQDNRPFRGHLTLARVRDPLLPEHVKVLQGEGLGPLPPIEVDGFSLVASTLGPQGPRHTEWAFFPLRK